MAQQKIAVIGGGPSGLMAADLLSAAGFAVTVYDAMPSVGRKFLLAGKSGLNLTHSEEFEPFVSRYGQASDHLREMLTAFDSRSVRGWAQDLGVETFVGSSGRVFPKVMKASPLLRAWLKRLDEQGVQIKTRHRFQGFANGALLFETANGPVSVQTDATLLALGGASWPKLGSDAKWVSALRAEGVEIADFRPANCGFDVDWSPIFSDRFAGEPVKAVTASSPSGSFSGEFVITKTGIEGSLIYAHASVLRDQIEAERPAELLLDLAPNRSLKRLELDLAKQDKKASFSNRLRKAAGIEGVKAALIRECFPGAVSMRSDELAKLIKALPISVIRTRPIAEAISSAGGIRWDSIDSNMMLKSVPGVFAAGEMIDWEAPTGGYLLTACFATGVAAAKGIENWLNR